LRRPWVAAGGWTLFPAGLVGMPAVCGCVTTPTAIARKRRVANTAPHAAADLMPITPARLPGRVTLLLRQHLLGAAQSRARSLSARGVRGGLNGASFSPFGKTGILGCPLSRVTLAADPPERWRGSPGVAVWSHLAGRLHLAEEGRKLRLLATAPMRRGREELCAEPATKGESAD
jgi:hypothetical protein